MNASRERVKAKWVGYRGYSHAEMAATMVVTRTEDPRWRWLFPVTRSTRSFLTSQFPALLVTYGVAVALIGIAAVIERSVPLQLLEMWLAESVLSIAIRTALVARVSRASPVEIARRPLLRLLPLFAIVLAALHWSWTAVIFVGAALDLTTVVVLLVFVMLSVAAVGVLPATPVICLVYMVPMWLVTAYELLHADWVSVGTFAILLAAVAAILLAASYVVVSGVRRNLIHGDEVDLLVDELRKRNAEVEGLRTAAGNDLATRSSFFASASHDFRQRVHAMKLLAQSSPDDGPNVDAAALARLSSILEDLESYMTEVLQFARLEATTSQAQRRPQQLQQVFQQIELRFEDVASARRVDLRVRATRVVLNTDGALLLRVLENLVSNAIKFTRSQVHIAARRRGPNVSIEVRDQGAGIPPECVDRIFDAFYQVREAPDAAQGVGLGLAIVKRLTDALGYRIEVQSTPGRGTLMRVLIPVQDVIA